MNTFEEALRILADNGIEVRNDKRLKNDQSVYLDPEDGHLWDFGKGIYYRDARDLIRRRPDLVGGEPVAVNSGTRASKGKEWTPEYLLNEYQGLRQGLRDMRKNVDVGNTRLLTHLSELLPKEWWDIDNLPECLGFHTKWRTLGVSVFNEDRSIAANTFRRVGDTKWLTHGTKRTPAMRLSGKKRVYFASGMGEALMLEILGVDYIVIQSDSVAKHLPEVEIEELVILPDNDESFREKIPFVVDALRPQRALVVEWGYSDPREAAKALITPHSFTDEVEKHLVELEMEPAGGAPIAEEESDFLKEFEPTEEDVAFARVFAKIARNLFGWKPNRGLYENWKILHRVFDDAVNGIGKTQAVTIGAGEGKSKGTALYTATEIVRQGKSALIVVNLNINGHEMVEDVNAWSGVDAARLFHSKDDEFDQKAQQVLIITHAMLRRTLHGTGRHGLDEFLFLEDGSRRDLIVIDEAIDLRKAHTVTAADLNGMLSALHYAPKKANIEDEVNTLAWVVDLLEKTDSKPKIHEMPDIPEEYPTEFRFIRSYLDRKTEGGRDPYSGKRWDDVIDNIEALLLSRHFRLQTGRNVYMSTAEDYMPKDAPVVILDASADIDHIYTEYEKADLLRIVKTKSVRTFAGCRFTFIPAETSNGWYKGNAEQAASAIAQEIEESAPGSHPLLITHKAMRPALESISWNQRGGYPPKIMTWGAITGRNDAKDRDSVFIVGLPYRDRATTLNKSYAINDTVSDKALERAYRDTEIAADVYQAIMRSALRVPQEDGGCIPVRVFITVPIQQRGTSASIGRALKEILPKKFPGAVFDERKVAPGVKAFGLHKLFLSKLPLKFKKLTPTQRKILTLLDDREKTEKLLSKSEYPGIVERKRIEKALKIAPDIFRRAMTKDFIQELRAHSYTYDRWVVPSQGRSRRMRTAQGFVEDFYREDVRTVAEYRDAGGKIR